MRWDVVVIGAGPSGSSAAYYLARQGYAVMVVEKSSFPRPKACGDGLTPRALAALDRMGLRTLWQRCLKIEGIRIMDPRSTAETVLDIGDESGVTFGGVLPRFELDNELLQWAARAGAEVLTETTVTGLRNGDGGLTAELTGLQGPAELSARFVVIADGAAGPLSCRLLKRPKRTEVDLFAVRQYFHTTIDIGPFFEIHAPLLDNSSPAAGYTWIFPVSANMVNVGSGIARTANTSSNLRRLFESSVHSLIEGGRLDGLPCGPLVGAPLPVALDPALSVGEGWMVVGDAAGVVNPFTGEGIAQALESGELAFRAVHSALQAGRSVAEDYPQLLEQRFRRRMRLGDTIPDLLASVRTCGWTDVLGGNSNSRRRAIRNLVLDRKRTSRCLLWEQLTKDVSNPRLWRAFDEIGARIAHELALVSPLFAETAAEMRMDANLCGYGTLLVLTVAASFGDIGDEALLLAELVELTALQDSYHGDMPSRPGTARINTSFNVLAGDAAIARLFAVLNRVERAQAMEVSARLQSHADCMASQAVGPGSAHLSTGFVPYIVGLVTKLNDVGLREDFEQWAFMLIESAHADAADVDFSSTAKVVASDPSVQLLTANAASIRMSASAHQ